MQRTFVYRNKLCQEWEHLSVSVSFDDSAAHYKTPYSFQFQAQPLGKWSKLSVMFQSFFQSFQASSSCFLRSRTATCSSVRIIPFSATCFSSTIRRFLKFFRSLRSQIELTPLEEINSPSLRNSLLVLTYP